MSLCQCSEKAMRTHNDVLCEAKYTDLKSKQITIID